MDLLQLRGMELASIIFVRDYLQLDFDGPRLTLFVWPTVKKIDQLIRKGDPGYLDALWEQIPVKVGAVAIEKNAELSLRFVDGVEFTVSLRAEDAVGPEAGYFSDEKSPDILSEF